MVFRISLVMLGIFYIQISFSQDSLDIQNKYDSTFYEIHKSHNKLPDKLNDKISGSISVGFDNYSNNSLMLNENQSGYSWRSEISFSLFKIPFGFNFNHSSLDQLNYSKTFKAFFDKNKFERIKKKEISASDNSLTAVQDSLYKLKQQQTKKLAYSEYKLKNLKKFNHKIETLDIDSINYESDSLKLLTAKNLEGDVVEFEPKDTLSARNISHKKDSLELLSKIENYKKDLADIETKITETERNLKEIKYTVNGKLTDKKQNLFDNIRTFEVGYSYPSYSKFLIKGNLLKGVNLEYEDDNRYLAFSYGKIAKNFPTINFQNPFEQFTSFFNTDYSIEKNVMAVKTGMGKKYGTHFFIGGLYGKGSTGNYFTSGSLPANKNIVLEADVNLQLNKSGNFNIIYAKSFLSYNNLPQQDYLEFVSRKTSIAETSLTYRFRKIVDKIELNAKYSEPLFKSFGINYITTDYLIYKAEAHKILSNKLRCNLGYKKENYNLEENAIPIRINSLLVGLDYKISRKLKLSSSFQPSIGSEQGFNNNFLSNFLITYFDINDNSQTNITASFNDFRIINDTSDFTLQNFVIGANYTFKKFILGSSVLHLRSNELNRNYETIYNVDVNYQITERLTSLVGAKYSNNRAHQKSDGFIVKIDYVSLILGGLNLTALYEKRVFSEMYYINFINPDIFKYYSKVQLTYNF